MGGGDTSGSGSDNRNLLTRALDRVRFSNRYEESVTNWRVTLRGMAAPGADPPGQSKSPPACGRTPRSYKHWRCWRELRRLWCRINPRSFYCLESADRHRRKYLTATPPSNRSWGWLLRLACRRLRPQARILLAPGVSAPDEGHRLSNAMRADVTRHLRGGSRLAVIDIDDGVAFNLDTSSVQKFASGPTARACACSAMSVGPWREHRGLGCVHRPNRSRHYG